MTSPTRLDERTWVETNSDSHQLAQKHVGLAPRLLEWSARTVNLKGCPEQSLSLVAPDWTDRRTLLFKPQARIKYKN